MYQDALISLQFLTVFNIKKDLTPSPEDIGTASFLFPIIGFVIGSILVVLSMLLLKFFPMPVINVIILVASFAITGGMHVDGLSDTLDGFIGGCNKEARLKIMKDSAAGAFGVWGITISILAKYVLLNNIPAHVWASSLICMGVLSRFSQVQLGYISLYAGISKDGLGRPFTDYIKRGGFLKAVIITTIIIGLLLGLKGILILLIISSITICIKRISVNKIDGITGDVLGATSEVNEVCVLLLTTLLF